MTKGSKWLDQAAPGRVFEIRRKTWAGGPVCVMTMTGPSGLRAMNNSIKQVGDQGCVGDLYGGRARARTYVGGIGSLDFGRLVVRRRPDLERFDPRDLALIAYGVKLEFGGRMIDRHSGPAILPSIPGVTWSAFWTAGDYWPYGHDRSDVARAEASLRGAWHQSVRNDFRDTPRAERGTGYLTAQDDPRKLAEIRRALAALGMVHEARIRIVARDEGPYYAITQHGGEDCPLVSRTRFQSSVPKEGSRYDFATCRYVAYGGETLAMAS